MHSTDRNQFIDGLRQLADFLDANPDVPVPYCPRLGVHADSQETGGREQVDKIAAALGTGIAEHSSDSHYYTEERYFGPISYYAVSISDAEMARHRALMSYSDSVVPDTGTAA